MHLHRLSNNQELLTATVPHTQRATVVAYVRSGCVFENKTTNGSAHIIEHLLFQGSERFPTSDALQHHLDDHNLSVGGMTTKEYTTFNVECHLDKLETAVETLEEMLFHSRFDPSTISQEQKILNEELAEKESSPSYALMRAVDHALYNDSPFSLPTGGSRGSIRSLDPDRIRALYTEQYTPANTVFCIAANKTEEKLTEIGETYLATAANDKRMSYPSFTPEPAQLGHNEYTHPNLNERSLLTWSFFTSAPYIQQENLVWILLNMLRKRVRALVREKHGLAYKVSTDWQRYTIGNQLDIDIECSRENRDRVIELVEDEITNIEFTAQETERSKERLRQELTLLSEDPSLLADYLATQQILFPDLPFETPEQDIAKLSNITGHNIAKTVNDFFSTSRSGLFSIQN